MTMRELARQFRLKVMPDRVVGQTTFNSLIRAEHTRIAVADRACKILQDLGGYSEVLDELQAMAYGVGTLDRPGVCADTLRDAGLDAWTVRGIEHIHGMEWDNIVSYYTRLAWGCEEFRLVRGALAIAELKDLTARPLRVQLRVQRRVIDDMERMVVPMLMRVPLYGPVLCNSFLQSEQYAIA